MRTVTPPVAPPPYVRRSLLVNNRPSKSPPTGNREKVRLALKRLGVSPWGSGSLEAHYLPRIIHPDEYIGGILYGFCNGSFVMLIATDRRVIFLDKKPLFVDEDEITYYVVSGVTYNHAGIGSTVTLHTRIKDYTIRTFNDRCARGFVEYLESRCLEHTDNRRLL